MEKKTALKITKEAKDNQFVDCEIEGAKIDGQRTLFLRTKIFYRNNKKKVTVSGVIFIIAAVATIYSVFFAPYDSNLEVNNSPQSINTINQIGDNTLISVENPGPRKLTEVLKVDLENILQQYPVSNINVWYPIRNREATSFAEEVLAFLREKEGYKIESMGIAPINQLSEEGSHVSIDNNGQLLNIYIDEI